ncbi:MAG: hypothetical protein COV07_03840 [Candidatus Vogelbacteria bacterium CG10_big_fil_rev_8_21_14_0_10_45_14]|uniref:Uncharacterized protein n=1 Tax=Candidatus Vogelbacteria bacterium CG10_big_fil_rev_8_21_14_0_10_45_14 TaxID=1975042 RepID=A0A2H0RIZ2_9BACT|nr:MAG: hypothetical protein COV07_03840 [Candidatus Vogelbacteria bacterium CG10_big_fil_rev_8_21_14_0_10_45_14]
MNKKIINQVIALFLILVLASIIPADKQSIKGATSLTLRFGNKGQMLVREGVIDKDKLSAIYEGRGGIPEEIRGVLLGKIEELVITEENAGIALNFLWALGLANKSKVLSDGQMMNPRYGGAENFASTGGWTLSRGVAMDHYGMHDLVDLSVKGEKRVENVASNIYRPCCDNHTAFPDCNHGMAMLGALSLLGKLDASEDQMYEVAYKLNRMWFPGEYAHLNSYLEKEKKIASIEQMVGMKYMSASGHATIMKSLDESPESGSGCVV